MNWLSTVSNSRSAVMVASIRVAGVQWCVLVVGEYCISIEFQMLRGGNIFNRVLEVVAGLHS